MTFLSNTNVATDIRIQYDAKKFKDIAEWLKNMDYTAVLLLVALYGFKHNRFFQLEAKDTTGDTHDFSRTVYNHNEFSLDTYYGLLTILDNREKEPTKVIDELAFAKTKTHNLPYNKLPNVRTFYGYLIGGIKPLHEDLSKYGANVEEMAITLYDLVMDDSETFDSIIEEINLREYE